MIGFIARWSKAFTKADTQHRCKRILIWALVLALTTSLFPLQGLAVLADELDSSLKTQNQNELSNDLSNDLVGNDNNDLSNDLVGNDNNDLSNDLLSNDNNDLVGNDNNNLSNDLLSNDNNDLIGNDNNDLVNNDDLSNSDNQGQDSVPKPIEVSWSLSNEGEWAAGSNIYISTREATVVFAGDFTEDDIEALKASSVKVSYVDRNSTEANPAIQTMIIGPAETGWVYDAGQSTLTGRFNLDIEGIYRSLQLVDGNETALAYTGSLLTLVDEVLNEGDEAIFTVVIPAEPEFESDLSDNIDNGQSTSTSFYYLDQMWVAVSLDGQMVAWKTVYNGTVNYDTVYSRQYQHNITMSSDEYGYIDYEYDAQTGETTLSINHLVDGEYLVQWGTFDNNSYFIKEREYHYEVDRTAPLVSINTIVDGNKTEVVDGGYYSGVDTKDGATRQIVVRVEDRHFDESQISVLVTPVDERATFTVDGPKSVGQKHNCYSSGEWKESSDTDVHEYVITLSEDGQYRVDVKGASAEVVDSDDVVYDVPKDALGNQAHVFSTGTFTFDTENPLIDVSFDNNEVFNNKYYAATRTATIAVSDDNFDETLVHVYVNGEELEGVEWAADHTCTVPFVKDGEYELEVRGEDKAGRELGYWDGDAWRSGYDSGKFVIDTINPVVLVSYDVTTESGYYSTKRKATIYVSDVNFDDNLSVLATIAKANKDQGAPNATAWLYDQSTGAYSCEIVFDVDGEYEFIVRGTDLAGNEVGYYEDNAESSQTTWVNDYDSGVFVIDLTNPYVQTNYKKRIDNDGTTATQNKTGNFNEDTLYYASDQVITVVVRDRNLDTDNSMLTYDGKTIDASKWDASEADENGVITYTVEIPYGEGAHEAPSITTSDLALRKGNEVDVDTFVIDKSAPVVDEVKINAVPAMKGADELSFERDIQFFNNLNGTTTITFVVKDNLGIDSVTLSDPDNQYSTMTVLEDNGTNDAPSTSKTLQVVLLDGASNPENDTEFSSDVILTITDIAGNWRIWSLTEEGVVYLKGGEIETAVTNTPLNDEENVYPYALIKDATAPIVTLEGVEEGVYYNTTQTVIVKVDEFNFSYLQRFAKNRGIVQVTKAEGVASGETTSYVGATADLFNEENSLWTCGMELAEDGHYIVKSAFKDYAENESNEAIIGTFTVDKTAPTMKVTWGEGDSDHLKSTVGEIDYYDATRTATITVVEHNFDPDLFTITAVGKLGDYDISGDVGEWVTDSANSDIHTITVDFPSDGGYKLTVTGADLAGNTAVLVDSNNEVLEDFDGAAITIADSGIFIIDTVDPVITTSYSDTAQANEHENGVPVYGTDKAITITVADRNLNVSNSTISISIDGSVKSLSLDDSGWSTSTAEDGNVTYTYVAEYTENIIGKHTTPVLSANDYAARVASLDGADFIIDETAPDVTTTYAKIVSDNATGSFSDYTYFNTDQTITVTVKDRHLRVPDSTLIDDVDGNTINASKWTATQPDNNGIVTYTYTINYAEGVHRSPIVSVQDYANQATDEQGYNFVIDKTAPKVAKVVVDRNPTSTGIDGSTGSDPIQFFNQATTMTITLSDVYGMKSITLNDPENQYVITNPIDNTVLSRPITSRDITIALADGARNLRNDTEFEQNITLRVEDIAGNWRTWSITRTGEIQTVSSGRISSANASINSGSVYPYSLIEDITNPTIALSGVTEGTYYNSPQTMTAAIDEFNFSYLQRFDGTRSIVRVTEYANAASRAQSSSEITASMFTGSGSTWSYDRVFDQDGHYVVEAGFSDYANNPSNTTSVGEFTIDMTNPVISVEWDNNDVLNGKYYKASRTATITIIEHNFDPSRVYVQVNGDLLSNTWASEGDTHVMTVAFESDGVYTLTVEGSDLADNKIESYSSNEFVIDQTNPEIQISFLDADDDDQRAFNDVVRPVIEFEDSANFDIEGIEYSLTRNKETNPVDYNSRTNSTTKSATVTYDDFERIIDVDDIYTLSAHMTDLAGNEAEAEVVFSVNRFGSNFIIESPASSGDDPSDLGFLAEAPEIIIHEINVTGVEEDNVDISVTLDTKPVTLTQQSSTGRAGYVVRDVSDSADYGWQEYEYVISRESFESEDGSKDGNYLVAITSEDNAGNKTTSSLFKVAMDDSRKSNATDSENDTDTERSMTASVKFTLDTTNPEILGLAFEDGEVIDNGKVVNHSGDYVAQFTVSDTNFDASTLTIKVANEEVQPASVDENTGNVTFVLEEKPFEYQTIEIKAADYAGNEGVKTIGERAEGQESANDGNGIKISSNIIDLYGVFIGTGVVVLAAAGIAGGYFASKRRKNSIGADQTPAA